MTAAERARRGPAPGADPEDPAASVDRCEDVQADPELSLFIAAADRVMEGLGFTEHGFRHANLVARIAFNVLHRLGFDEREADLACVAGYLHDIGNMVTRETHGQTGRRPRLRRAEGSCGRQDLTRDPGGGRATTRRTTGRRSGPSRRP